MFQNSWHSFESDVVPQVIVIAMDSRSRSGIALAFTSAGTKPSKDCKTTVKKKKKEREDGGLVTFVSLNKRSLKQTLSTLISWVFS